MDQSYINLHASMCVLLGFFVMPLLWGLEDKTNKTMKMQKRKKLKRLKSYNAMSIMMIQDKDKMNI